MNYEQLVEALVHEGAIRIYQVSESLGFAYRWEFGQVQVRSFVRTEFAEDKWALKQRLVGSVQPILADGWYPTGSLPPWAKPIKHAAAHDNPGYYSGMIQQCQTCRRMQPLGAFERHHSSTRGYRTWECNDCYHERLVEVRQYEVNPGQRVGDYIKRPTHASRPPVETGI